MEEERRKSPRPELSSKSLDLERLLEERERLEAIIKQKFTRIVTIMFTDMQGSTSLAETAGDVSTRYLIKKHNDIVLPSIRESGGVLVKTMGDGTLSYFESAADAARAAVRIQREIWAFNARGQAAVPLQVRIGLNTGTGIVEKNDIFGDAVNVASRYEGLAHPGEIYLSESTHEAVGGQEEFCCRYVATSHIEGKKGLFKIYKIQWDEREIARERAGAPGATTTQRFDETITLSALQRVAESEDSEAARAVLARARQLERDRELVELFLLAREHAYPTLVEIGRRLGEELGAAGRRETSLGGKPALWLFRDTITLGRVPEADVALTNKAFSRVPLRFSVQGGAARLRIEAKGIKDLMSCELERDGARAALQPDVEVALGSAGTLHFAVCFPLEYRMHRQRFLVLRLLDPRDCLRRKFTFTLEEIWRDFGQESARLIVLGT